MDAGGIGRCHGGDVRRLLFPVFTGLVTVLSGAITASLWTL